MPVNRSCSSLVMVVAQEVDELVVLPGDLTQISNAPEFVSATFANPLAKFLGVVLTAWHDGAHWPVYSSVVEERDRVVKTILEQHVAANFA